MKNWTFSHFLFKLRVLGIFTIES